jgi:hypothetical protein
MVGIFRYCISLAAFSGGEGAAAARMPTGKAREWGRSLLSQRHVGGARLRRACVFALWLALLAGDPGDDYLPGIAALDSGNALDAVFAFERVVDLAPDNGPARAELARAHLALGGALFELSDRSLELDSAMWDLTAGLRFTSPLSQAHGLGVYGGIDLSHRLALSAADFTTTDAADQLGVHLRRDKHQFRVGLEADRLKVDGGSTLARGRELGVATAQWQHSFSDTDQITVFGQCSMLRYPEQRVRKVNRHTGGLGYAHVFSSVTG